jgi:methylated-DNA-protein-cysteine methyltransferase-like protein
MAGEAPTLLLPVQEMADVQRVISAKGVISPRGDDGQGVARQKTALQAEGVEVVTLAGGGGEKVDVRRYGWFPEQVDLP